MPAIVGLGIDTLLVARGSGGTLPGTVRRAMEACYEVYHDTSKMPEHVCWPIMMLVYGGLSSTGTKYSTRKDLHLKIAGDF